MIVYSRESEYCSQLEQGDFFQQCTLSFGDIMVGTLFGLVIVCFVLIIYGGFRSIKEM